MGHALYSGSHQLPAERVYRALFRRHGGVARMSAEQVPQFRIANPIHLHDEIAFGTGRQMLRHAQWLLRAVGSVELPMEGIHSSLRWAGIGPYFDSLVRRFFRGSGNQLCYCWLATSFPLGDVPDRRPSVRVKQAEPCYFARPRKLGEARPDRGWWFGMLNGDKLPLDLRCLGLGAGPAVAGAQVLYCQTRMPLVPGEGLSGGSGAGEIYQEIMQVSPPAVVEAVRAGDFARGGVSDRLQPLYHWRGGVRYYFPYSLRFGKLTPRFMRVEGCSYFSHADSDVEELFISVGRVCGWASRIGVQRMRFQDLVGLYPVLGEAIDQLASWVDMRSEPSCR
jgi:hypothetical protein